MRSRFILQVLVVALAFGVGMLLGAEHCARREPPEEPAPRPVLTCPQCPSCEEKTPVSPSKTEKQRRLPPAPPPDARHRELLLAWVQEQSPELRHCTQGAASSTHTVVTLWLDDEGEVSQVELSHDPGSLEAAEIRCLRGRMLRWRPPLELVENRDRLVFGLVM